MIILKQEINQIGSEIHNLSRWKIVAVGSFVIVGLGWGGVKPEQDTGLLLLYSVGYLCLYLDMLYYRRATVIHLAANYLRRYEGSDEEMIELRDYERAIGNARLTHQFYISDRWTHIGATLLFSVGPPVLGIIQYKPGFNWLLIIPIIAFALNIAFFVFYSLHRKELAAMD